MPIKLTEFDFFHIFQALIESVSIPCVNCFLVITGWYGVKFRWTHIWTIWSILVWIYVPFYIFTSIQDAEFSSKLLVLKILSIPIENYYVQCYLMLLFLSPILNTFIERFGRKVLPYSLAFWMIEILFDWLLNNSCLGFGHGYMLSHFVLMYILGRTAFLYKDEILPLFSVGRSLLIYLSGVVMITLLYVAVPSKTVYAYSNPINVIISFSLFFCFEKYKLYNTFINKVAESTLAVYICHVTPPVYTILYAVDKFAMKEERGGGEWGRGGVARG